MAKLRITYRDATHQPDEVALGAFAQIAAKRRYGLEVAKSDDPEFALFGVYVELHGPAAAKDHDGFDEWLFGVERYQVIGGEEDPDNPPLAETLSSDSSPESPPTSE